MARKKGQKTKSKAVTDGKKPARGRPRRSKASSTSAAHDAAPAPTATATENKKPTTMTGIGKRTTRRMPARTGKRDPWSEEQLTTSAKSRLVNADLVKLFANPNSWTCLDEDEKRELLSLLPAHIHPNPGPDPDDPDHKIEPLPQSFLRYSNNWRDAVRGFQFDLESGRYDPEWQAQAAQAMEERVSGNFDQFKEDQFEEFWGQKQKLSYDVETGDSNHVKLETLVQNRVVRVGDIWKFSRIYVKDGSRILLEKEIKILSVDESNGLTFAIPGGHRVFLSQDYPKTESPAAQAVSNNASTATQPKTEITSETVEPKQIEIQSKPEAATVAGPDNGTAVKPEAETEDSVELQAGSAVPDSNPTGPLIIPSVDVDAVSKEDTPMPMAPAAAEDAKPTNPSNIPVVDGNPTSEEHTPMPGAPPSDEGNNSTGLSSLPIADGELMPKDDTPMSNAPPIAHPAAADNNNPTESSNLPIADGELTSKEDTPMPSAPPPSERNKSPSPSSLPIADGDHASKEDTPMPSALPPVEDAIVQDTTSENVVPQNARSDAIAIENNTAEQPASDVAISGSNSPGGSAKDNTNTNHTTNPDADVILARVLHPSSLGVKILNIDGRITKPSHGNAWKDFRCIRDNQDMGTLWEVRQAWSVRGK